MMRSAGIIYLILLHYVFIHVIVDRSSHVSVRSSHVDDDDKLDYDSHGCCLSCGEIFCHSSSKCVSDWDDCSFGIFDTKRCLYHYNNSYHGFSYDLSSLQLATDQFYEVTDEVSHPQQTFKYFFNICSNVKSSVLPKACLSTTGSGGDKCSSDALAYQYFSADWGYDACYRLSTCDKSLSTSSVSERPGIYDSSSNCNCWCHCQS
jgi:hypothetical protein